MKTEVQGRKRKIFTFSIALFGALVLWMYAIGYDTEIDTKTYTGIMVEIDGVNTNGYTVADGDSFSLSVDVRLAGTRRVLNEIKAEDLSAYVDISSVGGPGLTTLPVKVVAPNGSTVESVSVPNVTLYVDTFTSRTLTIHIEETYSSSYTIGEMSQSLYAVSVYGPESIISTAEAYTSIDLGDVTTPSFHVSGEIRLRDAETKAAITNPYVTMSSNTVDLTFTMYGQKTVPLELVLRGGTLHPEDVRFVSSVDSVVLSGPMDLLAQVDVLSVFCDESALEDKLLMEVTPEELLEANGLDKKILPVTAGQIITYSVEIPYFRTKTVTVAADKILFVNVPEDGSVTVESLQDLEVTLLGTLQAINGYKEKNLTVTVDFQTLEADPVTGIYKGAAMITTGDSRVCIDRDYIVLVSVTENADPAYIG